MVELKQGDCIELMKDIPGASVDMVLCDLPYAVTDFSWDVIIPCDKLFAEYRRILKQNANIVLFCQQPFTTTLINGAFKTEFSHSLVWKKNNKTRAKSSNTVPLSSYEEIIVFRVNKVGNKSRHKRLREYFTCELAKYGYSINELEELIPNRGAHHWFRFSSDFRIPMRQYQEAAQREGYAAAIYICNAMYTAAMLTSLRECLGFRQRRLKYIHDHVQKNFEALRDREISYQEVAQALMDECRINLVIERPDGLRRSAEELFAAIAKAERRKVVLDVARGEKA